jgi:DNA mismatch endonuclease, patch repair protein
MRAVKGRDTTPELAIRRLLRTIAPGYRLHRTDIPGKPDIVFLARKQAIFVHGCFWHGHDCARGARMPKTNTEYWSAKIGRNRVRDTKNRERLKQAGWRSLVVWECELRDEAAVSARLKSFLSAEESDAAGARGCGLKSY